MGKQWVKAEIKRNEIQVAVDKTVLWVSENRQTASIAAGAAAVALLAASLFVYHARSIKDEAWSRLGLAQDLAGGGRADLALKQIQELTARYPNTDAAGFGLLLAGDILYPQGQYKEAIDNYRKVLEGGAQKALQPIAMGDIGLSLEASGLCQQAVETDGKFLETYPDHFLAPQVHASLARCLQALGQTEQAKAAYQKIALQYPQSVWAEWAQNRLQPAGAKQ